MIILNTTYSCRNKDYSAFITHFTEKEGKLFCNAIIFKGGLTFCDAVYTHKGLCICSSLVKYKYVDRKEFDIAHNFHTFEQATSIMGDL
jgi:hypothetical protein